MVGLINLQSTFDALHHTKEDGQEQDQYSHPECIPLHAIAPVPPPLSKCVRSGLIEDLLEYDEAVVPEGELLDLSVVGFQLATFNYFSIDMQRVRYFSKPFGGIFVELWEK